MKRNIYLENVPMGKALELWKNLLEEEGAVFPIPAEIVLTSEAFGRVTASSVFAKISSPPFNCAAMDGVAAKASSTYSASESNPVLLKLSTDVEMIDTGDALKPEYDCVIMVEDLDEVSEGVYEIRAPLAPWTNVRTVGEDIVASELILPPGHIIRPADIGGLINGGVLSVEVRLIPRIAVIPTGSELVEKLEDLSPGKVIESNSFSLSAYITSLGGEPCRTGIVPDERERIRDSILKAVESADAVVVNAGTSAGREDFTKSILEEIGRVAVHGVAMKPGKPVILGVVRGKPLLGLPGFPVANLRAAEEFLGSLMSWFLGIFPRVNRPRIKCKMARKTRSQPGFDEFVEVKVGKVGDELIAVPLARGSGISMSLVRSDGDVRIPADAEGVAKGDEVEVLLRGFDVDPEGTIIAIGSHDVALDILSGHLRRIDSRYSLASSNVGSISGILAIKEGVCHIAGTHLLDPKSGEFNIPYVVSLVGKEDLLLVQLSWRLQGIMVQKGNPKGIKDLGDLTRKDVRFVNRQKGSGTRLLLDYELESRSISPDEVQGYKREAFTHTQVAAAVASGTADAGLGIKAAAQALGVDFVPVTRERYDILVSGPFSRTPAFKVLLRAVKDSSFRREVEALGGYELSDSGKIISLEG